MGSNFAIMHDCRYGQDLGLDSRMIDEQPVANLSLEEASALAAAFVEQSPVGILVTDARHTIRSVNAAFAAMIGVDTDTLIGAHLHTILEWSTVTPAMIVDQIRDRACWHGQLCFHTHHGQRVRAQVTGFAIEQAAGNGQWFGYHVQMLALEALPGAQAGSHWEETRFQRAANAGQVGIWDWDVESGAIYLSPILKGFLGYADHEISNHIDDWSRHIHPADQARVAAMARACLDGETACYVAEHRMLHKDGSVRWILANGEVAYDSHGRAVRLYGTDTDITERKRTESQLRRYEYIVSATLDSISLVDQNYTYQIVNRAYSERSTFEQQAIVGRSVADIMGADLFQSMLQDYLDRCLSGETVHYRAWFTYIGAGQRFMDVTYTPYRNEDDHVEGVVVSARDITELKQTEESLQRRLSQFDALRETMNRITSELDLDRLLRAILERATSLLDASNGQVLQYNPERNDLLVLACTNMEPDFSGNYQPLTEHGTGMVVRSRQPLLIRDYQTWESRLNNYAGFGAHAILLVPLLAGDQVLGIVSIGHTDPEKNFDEIDVELLTLFAQQATIALKNARLFAEVQRLATTDSLTGLHNRRSFFDMAQRLYDHAIRYNRPLSAIMLDVDHFKQINDSFGHAIGDQVLRAMADTCIATLRTIDVVGRYGGEEFVFLLPETDQAGACLVAERLRHQVLAEPVQTEHGALAITVSLGVSEITATCRSLEQLIDFADQALYTAKQQGRNRVMGYVEKAT